MPLVGSVALNAGAGFVDDHGVRAALSGTRNDVFGFLEDAVGKKQSWDVVIADPPAFVKSRKDLKAGLQGYRKLARLCATVTAPGGILFVASCSHNAPLEEFTAAVARGVTDASRGGAYHPHLRRGAGPSGAPVPAGKRLSEGRRPAALD